ncbi:ATP-NAD kinase PpnK-type alpha/beta [Penicillium bovifimosum]|uniref:ATP-NAD kinase PpnK-type alpha/beta n=1 Tax=Penicillium bovifimosum TaxID=126998 RepID=A0A9W9KXD2_9EURO|nr:ATP-NAD kinase PpnK-type alpha/beta [Penicillium bovifimosum]KAJ5124467.1 ATP-NAD kinase PpnK-type alpha/beta [Penicillium bovifimosum]
MASSEPLSDISSSTATPSHPSPSPANAPPSTSTALLRDYAFNLEPSSPNESRRDPLGDPLGTSALPVQSFEPVQEEATGWSLPSASLRPFRRKSTQSRSKKALSTDCIPRQTLLKALASRPSLLANNNMSASSLATKLASKSTQASPPSDHRRSASSQNLSTALSNLQLSGYLDRSPATARLVLQSPCYFHQRFDDAVNIKKVLEEIADDEWLSHSRLVQTATGVREVSKQLQRRPIKRAVRNVMIVTKARDNSLVHLTREVAEWLLSTPRYGNKLGVNVYVDAKLRNSKRFDTPGLLQKDPMFAQMLHFWTPDLCWTSPDKFDLVLTLGGDGTVLFTSWLFQRVVPPVLCFSLGSLGFLTNFEFADHKAQLNAVMGEVGMRVNLRMRFTCTVYRKDRSKGAEAGAVEEGEQFEVLNELVIDRGPSPYVSNLELYADDELLTVVQADGCIFSTPTGSTAYSLSAGGSLMHPSIPGILLTPICPHTLSFRPMVLSDSHLLRIAVPNSSRSTAYCSFDGKGRVELRQGDYVTVEASQYPFPTVVSNNNEWFTSVQRALRWNTRGAIQKSWGGADLEAELNEEDEQWDIDTDTGIGGTDSGIGPSEDGDSLSPNPMRRQMSLLNM